MAVVVQVKHLTSELLDQGHLIQVVVAVVFGKMHKQDRAVLVL